MGDAFVRWHFSPVPNFDVRMLDVGCSNVGCSMLATAEPVHGGGGLDVCLHPLRNSIRLHGAAENAPSNRTERCLNATRASGDRRGRPTQLRPPPTEQAWSARARS